MTSNRELVGLHQVHRFLYLSHPLFEQLVVRPAAAQIPETKSLVPATLPTPVNMHGSHILALTQVADSSLTLDVISDSNH